MYSYGILELEGTREIISFILEMRKLILQKVMWLVQGHTISQWQNQNLHWSLVFFPVCHVHVRLTKNKQYIPFFILYLL